MSSPDTAVTTAPQSFARALLERASTEECAELALAGAHALTVKSSEARAFALLGALEALHEHAAAVLRRFSSRSDCAGPAALQSIADDVRDVAALLTLAAVEIYQTAGAIAAERAAGAVGAVEGSDAR